MPDPSDRTATLAPRDVPTAPSESAPVAGGPAPLPVDDPERYHVIGEHARGGLGRIVRAVDKRLGRTVAVKELLRHDAGHEARFMREALVTARLEHPGIVSVHEAGRWPNGEPYYVMKLVEGRTLKELIRERPTMAARLELLHHVIAIADAVGYAHSEGVIHRDLKPSNVLVGEFGETVVVDWGLARDREQDLPEPLVEQLASSSDGTISGRVVGTPGYMAPEQARGELVDERADVYALGAILYELLAGEPPHAAREDETPQSVVERVLAGPPAPLGRRATPAASELVDIVDKAMARAPEARYPNASALAEDLRRFQTGKLVSAHAYTPWQIVRKKLAQHRGVVTIALASAIALAAVGVESFRTVVAERDIARGAQGRAEDARAAAEQRRRELVLVQAQTSLRKDPTAALAWLASSPIADGDLAAAVDVIDEALALGVSRHVFRNDDEALAIDVAPDGRTLIAGSASGRLFAFDLVGGTRRELGRARSAIETLAISPDGKSVITGHALGEVMLWPLGDGEPHTLVDHGSHVWRVRFAPGARTVIVDRDPSPVELVSLDGGVETIGTPMMARVAVAERDTSHRAAIVAPDQIVALEPGGSRPIARASRPVQFLAMSPAGDAVIVHDGQSVLIAPFAGGPLRTLASYPYKLEGVTWSPDLRTLAIVGWGHDIVVVDVASGATRELRGHTDTVYEARFTRDGHELLSASDDGTARVWNLATDTSTVLLGHDDDVYRVRLTPDEHVAVTTSIDRSLRVWELGCPGARVLDERAPITSMRLDGDRALVQTAGGLARWDLTTGTREAVMEWPATSELVRPSPDGERVALAAPGFAIEIRRRDGAPVVLRGHRAPITELAWSHDGTHLYSSSHDGSLRRWDASTGAGVELVHRDTGISGFALAGDGQIAALAGQVAFFLDRDGQVHDAPGGSPACFRKTELVRDRWIAIRCDRGLTMMYGDRRIELDSDSARATDFAVSPDGTRIAASLGDRTIRVWSSDGRPLQTLHGHTDLAWKIAFSPDGSRLASASYDRTIRIWELGTDRHRVLRGHAASVGQIAWRSDRELVSASDDGTLRVWTVPDTRLPSAAELAHRIAEATTATIDDRDRATTPVAQ